MQSVECIRVTSNGKGVLDMQSAKSIATMQRAEDSMTVRYYDEALGRVADCCLRSQQQASVSQRRICSGNCTCCHTEVEKLQIKLSTSPSHSILTPGRAVPAQTLYCQAPGRAAIGVPMLKSMA